MAATIVNTGNGSTSTAVTSDTFSLGFTAAAGDALIVAVACNTKTRSVTSVADNAGNSGWVLLAGAGSSSAGNVYLFWNPSLAASVTSITTTYSGTSKVSVGWMEVSGLSGVVDGTPVATNITTSSTTQSQSVTTTANDFIIAAISVPGTPSASSADAPFTLEMGTHGSGSGTSETIADASEASAGTYTATFHLSAAAAVTIATAALEVATSAINLTATDANTSFGGAATPTVSISATATDTNTAFRGNATAAVTIHPTATDALTAFRGSASMTSGTFLTATDALTAFRGSATLTVTIAITATDALTQFRGGATMTFIPPFTPPGAGTPWEAYLCDRFGYPIQNISRVCFGKQYAATLNRPAQFTFWAPSNDAKIGGLHTDGNPYLMEGRAIRVYRAGTLVFAGHVWQIEDSGDENEEKTSVTCFDPLQWWSRRVARKMVYANLAIGSPSINLYISLFTNKDDDVYTFQSTNPHSSTETARGLLNSTNDYDGFTGLDDYYQSSVYRPNVATPSSVTNQSAPSSGNVNIAFANSRLSDLLTALVGQAGNFDLEVVPTDTDYYSSATAGPFHGGSRSATFQQAYKFGWAGDYDSIRGSLLTKPWKTLALLKYWAPLKGSQQDSVVFGYDAYPHNVSQISRLVDLQNLTNNSVMLGSQNWAREVNITSVQAYGAGMDVQGLSDIVDPVLLDALAAEEVQLGGNAKQTVQITPLGGARTPLPFDDFVLGDQVHVNAGSRLRGGFLGLQRVYGFVLDINDDHTTETLSSLVTSPQTS